VTGGSGFIGSHVVDALVSRGDDVLVVDDLSSGRRANLASAIENGARLLELSILQRDRLLAEVLEFSPQSTFHLAAQIDVRKSIEDPAFDASVNLVGTVNVLDALAALPEPASIVFASTGGAIYGEGEGRPQPMDESAERRPESPYGTAKQAAELYLDLYARTSSVRTASLRFANVYGPRQDPHGEAGVVAIFCGRIREGGTATVYGDGRQTRDYVYVDDVVAAMLAADAHLAGSRGPEGPFNVGTGRETSVLELIVVLGSVAGAEPVVEHAAARAGEVQRVAIDPGRAAMVLGWSPKVELRDGLARTYEALGGDR
jgi:UDP-glucose 4-epimerase